MPIAFKEWSLVCDALGSGEQSIILRKGGIAEGRDGFQFKHREFFLFPTHFHEQAKHLRLGDGRHVSEIADAEREHITVEYFAELVETRVITDWEQVRALEPLHLWTEATMRDRFDYEDCPGISLALVRISRLCRPWNFPNHKRYGGCRSWVEIPEPPADAMAERVPVLGEEAFARVAAELSG
ncbi:MAG: hypothetical protein ACI8XO_000141 [Verrucomicrobiales bacterium]